MTKTKSEGFGLLELLVVVLIIGILTAFAVPTYFDYVKKAKVAESTVLFSDFKLKTLIYYSEHGMWPPDVMTLVTMGVVTKGSFAEMQIYDSLMPAVCYTVVGFEAGKDSIGWNYLLKIPGTDPWSCKAADGACTTIESKYLPSYCQP